MTISSQPIVVEFAGTPSAGKTTTLRRVETRLKGEGISTQVFTEAAGRVGADSGLNAEKSNSLFNVWTASTAMAEMILAITDNEADVVLMDRATTDASVWLAFHEDFGDDDTSLLRSLRLTLAELALRVHRPLTVVLTCSFEEALRRRSFATGRIFTEGNFLHLLRLYGELSSPLRLPNQTVERISTESIDADLVSDRVFQSIHRLLNVGLTT